MNDERGLDVTPEAFRRELEAAVAMLAAHYAGMDAVPAFANVAEADVRAWFDEPLPEAGADADTLLGEVQRTVVASATNNLAPKMFAYVMSGGNQASVVAELIAAGLDQNVAKWHLSPAMTEIERRVVAWSAALLGLDADPGGAVVSGGSAANLTALGVARNLCLEQDRVRVEGLAGLPPLTLYGSSEMHSSLTKSVELLGLGSRHLRRIPVRDDFTIDLTALRAHIRADRAAGCRPFCVIGNAGTVNTGAIDPLDGLADVAREEGLWFHVDGAYGALAAGLPELAPRYAGLARADSIALDFHKWLYQPFEVGCALVRSWDALRRTFHTRAAYLDTDKHDGGRFDVTEHHFDLSRSAKAFKVWFSLKRYGAARLRAMIRKDIEMTRRLCALIDTAPDFELAAAGPLAIACFRYLGPTPAGEDAVDLLNERLAPALERDGRVFITGTRIADRPVLRACIINHRIGVHDVERLVDVVRDVGRRVAQAPPTGTGTPAS